MKKLHWTDTDFDRTYFLFLTIVLINIMHIHEAFHFFLISKNYHISLCMQIAYTLIICSSGFSSVTGSYKYNI